MLYCHEHKTCLWYEGLQHFLQILLFSYFDRLTKLWTCPCKKIVSHKSNKKPKIIDTTLSERVQRYIHFKLITCTVGKRWYIRRRWKTDQATRRSSPRMLSAKKHECFSGARTEYPVSIYESSIFLQTNWHHGVTQAGGS